MKPRESGYGNEFEPNERVRFSVPQENGNPVEGTGTVICLAYDHLIQTYIVMLDTPLPHWKWPAAPIQNGHMELIT